MRAPADMLVHAAAHLFADGDLAGGMRNLWDIHCLIEQFGTDGLAERARHHGLEREVHRAARLAHRSEEHTSELQSLMRISYAVFCLKKKKHTTHIQLAHRSIPINP